MKPLFVLALLATVAAASFGVLASNGCAPTEPSEPWSFTEQDRADFAVFSQRCSKCHSLSRPLNSGIDDDEYWVMYVARMRRQPQSGISPEDAQVILRFLRRYSLDQRRKKARARAADLADTPGPADAGAPAPGGADAGTDAQ